jgi:hypothetical protein
MKSLKQLLSKVKSGKMDKKTAKDLDKLVTRGDGFVVITKSKKDGYNRFDANQVDDRGIDVVPHYRDFKPGKVRGMMRYKPEHLLGDIKWKDVKDIYMENITEFGKHLDEPSEIGKKKQRLSKKDKLLLKKDLEERLEEKKNKGLWHNIHAKRKRGEKPAKPGEKGYPKTLKIEKKDGDPCWVGYKQIGMKDKDGKKVPNCVKEVTEIYYEVDGKGHGYTFEYIRTKDLNEAEYQGRKVKLGKPTTGDVKKFKVYVKNPKGNVVKVNFGHKGKGGEKTMRIKKSNPDARKSFRARHNCENPGPRHKARYWSCRKW